MTDSMLAGPSRSHAAAVLSGRYTLLEELGRGGMGVVHRARDESTGKNVALKLLLESKVADTQLRTLFEREYHTLAGLRHPRIIDVYEFGVCDAGPYYTMELLDGKDLREIAPVPYLEACAHLRDVASSLALLHARKLLHRDLSARNVRLTPEGRAKLLDFGALATFGNTSEIVGTPPFIAPEALLGSALDQRADLFALGALGYWLLTGTHAYPARTLANLVECWRTPPPPPSALSAGIPEALDALILSLLRFDALARPPSAAAVIDGLNGIAGLEADEEHHEAESYLASCGLVGRSETLQQLRSRVSRALAGEGSAVLIEGEAGLGKTRLLNELALEAQLQGVTVLRANVHAHGEPLGVVKDLSHALLRKLPAHAVRAAAPLADVLSHISDEVRERLGSPARRPLPQMRSEARVVLQHALLQWFMSVASACPLIILVDDLHTADDHSSALLAALSKALRTERLLIAAAVRKGAVARENAPALAILYRNAARIELQPLSQAEVDELVRGLFGDPADASRLAQLLYERSGGIPDACLALLRHAVSRELVKYVNGTWIVPPDLSSGDLPSGIDDILAARLDVLSEGALRYAQALSIHPGTLSLERCLWLREAMTDHQVFSALDELIQNEVLVGAQSSCRFRHEVQRQALSTSLSEERRHALHRSFAEKLAEGGAGDPATRLEIGWHLLRGGDELRGADVLVQVGLNQELPIEHSQQAVQGLLAALDVYDRLERSDYELAAVLLPLMNLAYYVDYRILRRHGERSVALGMKLTGLTRARRLRRYLGAKLALIVSLVLSAIVFSRARKRARGRGLDYSFRHAISLTSTTGPALAGTAAMCVDPPAVARVTDMLEPLGWFGERHVGGVLHSFCLDLVAGLQGRAEEVEQNFRNRVALLEQPDAVKGLPERSRMAFCGGNLLYLGLLQTYQHGSTALSTADRIEQLGFRTQAAAANQIRMLYHARRGEMHLAQPYRERVEVQAVQEGSTWQVEVWMPTNMCVTYFVSGDVVNLRRTYELLARQANAIPSLAVFMDFARACYLIARGDARDGAKLMQQVVTRCPPRLHSGWDISRVGLAVAWNACGEHAQAKAVCLETLGHMRAHDRRFVAYNGEIERQLALAEAGLGQCAEAIRLLDELLKRHETGDNPLYMGLLHKARAEIALRVSDPDGFVLHLHEMETWFKSTRNPILIAHSERVREAGVRAGWRVPGTDELSTNSELDVQTEASPASALLALPAQIPERCETALRRILSAGGAASGYLFLRFPQRLELAATYGCGTPPDWLCEQLGQWIGNEPNPHAGSVASAGKAASSDTDEDDEAVTQTTNARSSSLQLGDRFCRLVALTSHDGTTPRMVGVAVIELEPEAALSLNPALLRSVADALAPALSSPNPEGESAPRLVTVFARTAGTQREAWRSQRPTSVPPGAHG